VAPRGNRKKGETTQKQKETVKRDKGRKEPGWEDETTPHVTAREALNRVGHFGKGVGWGQENREEDQQVRVTGKGGTNVTGEE